MMAYARATEPGKPMSERTGAGIWRLEVVSPKFLILLRSWKVVDIRKEMESRNDHTELS
jgi:hypothetical protein